MLLDLDHAPGRSLRVRMENALRDAIRSGLLAPGTRVPSTRALAAQLEVSRGVVVEAYAQLAAEGYLRTRGGAGTTVAAAASTTAAIDGRRPCIHPPAPAAPAIHYDLSPFVPALHAFPRKAWAAALSRVLRDAPDERLALPAGAGVPELRVVLAAYLARVRGVRAGAEQVVVCNGLRQGLGLLWSALAADGAKTVVIEDPGWRGMAETVTDAGLTTMPIAVDDQGISVVHLAGQRARIDAVAVAPAHQYPTGAVLSPARRAALVQWAQQHRALIVEDDYDAEYRYDREPIGSLQGLAPEHVVYSGSTSKSLAPAVRLAWLVVPPRLVAPMSALQRRRGGMPAALQQLALAELIQRGELDRHLRRQRRAYRRQRDALLVALSERLPEATVHGAAAGLFVTLRLPAGADEQRVIGLARAAGVAVQGLGVAGPGLVVGYANLAQAAVAPAVAVLAASVRGASGRGANF